MLLYIDNRQSPKVTKNGEPGVTFHRRIHFVLYQTEAEGQDTLLRCAATTPMKSC